MSIPFEIEGRRQDIEAEIAKFGAELIDMSFRNAGGRKVLTLVVDKAGGINLDDCAMINGHLSRFLDELESSDSNSVIQGAYFLEVNSPGLDRPLKTAKDFLRAIGQTLRVATRDGEGRTAVDVGEAVFFRQDVLGLKLAGAGTLKELPLSSITKAVRELKFFH